MWQSAQATPLRACTPCDQSSNSGCCAFKTWSPPQGAEGKGARDRGTVASHSRDGFAGQALDFPWAVARMGIAAALDHADQARGGVLDGRVRLDPGGDGEWSRRE